MGTKHDYLDFDKIYNYNNAPCCIPLSLRLKRYRIRLVETLEAWHRNIEAAPPLTNWGREWTAQD